MYFILDRTTERTIAMTHFQDVAEIISANLPIDCIVRYAEESSYSYNNKNSKFFEDAKKIKKGA